MKMLAVGVVAAVLVLASSAGVRARAFDGLSVGDPAPPFALRGSDGRVHKLSDSVGKRAVVLAWFAKAFTGG